MTCFTSLLAEDPKWRADGRHVLVVYAADDADRDSNGKPDSQDLAEYYAARRNVPAANLLGIKIARDKTRGSSAWNYGEFYSLILKPVCDKLNSPGDGGRPLSEQIAYIVTCPPLPESMVTHNPVRPASRPAGQRDDWFAEINRKSVDQFLVSALANLEAGTEKRADSQPATQIGAGSAGPLGTNMRELTLPIHLAYSRPGQDKHFRQLRAEDGSRFNFQLVCRLGMDVRSGRDMLDGSLYAERYLRLPSADEKTNFRPAIWLDQKYQFAADQVQAMSRAVSIVQGAPGSPFAEGKGIRQVWPLVIDNQLAEIGLVANGVQHKPTVTGRIAAVDAAGVTLDKPQALGRGATDCPPAFYFVAGSRLTIAPPAAPASASAPAVPAADAAAKTYVVKSIDAAANRLLLDSTDGLKPGQTLQAVWPGTFPTNDCFIFYGFYGLGQYEDVFQFLPGAVGIHVDSSCMTWARGAMGRGIAASFGVTAEPLSIGIPHGDQVLLGLAQGYDWAESVYAGLVLSQRWAGVALGDPLYAPFRSKMLADQTPPALEKLAFTQSGSNLVVSARLGGTSDDQLADVALFRLEVGPLEQGATQPAWSRVIDFANWPEPDKSKDVTGRRFGYSRFFQTSLPGLDKSKAHMFRLTARDPAGLESSVIGTWPQAEAGPRAATAPNSRP